MTNTNLKNWFDNTAVEHKNTLLFKNSQADDLPLVLRLNKKEKGKKTYPMVPKAKCAKHEHWEQDKPLSSCCWIFKQVFGQVSMCVCVNVCVKMLW